MGRLLQRLGSDEQGHAVVGYMLITGVFSVLIFQPELAVVLVYQIADILSLLVSQIESVF